MSSSAYDDDDDAVRIANNSIYGLSGAVFGSEDRALAVARRIRTGTLSINGGMFFAPDSPFGGYKQSGIGREMGAAGLEEFLERKTIATVVSMSTPPLDGIRVLEVAMYGFVPSAGAVLTEWGADVIKVEHASPATRSAGCVRPACCASRETPTRTSSTPTATSAASGWTCRCPRARKCSTTSRGAAMSS